MVAHIVKWMTLSTLLFVATKAANTEYLMR